jgi:RNA polymerase sigma-70 factor (sigma-E family)
MALSVQEVTLLVPSGSTSREHDADFSEWMTARQSWLLRTAYLLTGDTHTAEDIVATCLAKLYLAWPRIESRGNVDAYARRTLVNETNSLWRRAWKRHEVIREHLPEQPIHHEHHSGDHEALWAFVNTLPTKQRSVVVLRYYEQLSEAEVAEVMGISIGTVKSQCSRALHTLRAGIHTRPELLPQQREPR